MDISQTQKAEAQANTPIILELNRFANLCGYFYNAYMRDGISANNGYNCSHPEQEEQCDDEPGKSAGCCYCWSCPLGYPPDCDDMLYYGIISEEDAKESASSGNAWYHDDNDYIVVSDPTTVAKLRERGITGLANPPKED